MLDSGLAQGSQDQKLSSGTESGPVSYADALENYKKNTDWWIIFDSFDLEGSKGSALWIASRTGFTVEAVTEALEGLVVLGLVKKSEQGFEKIKEEFDPVQSLSKAEVFEDHAMISRQVLNHLLPEAKGAVRFASFASNINIIAEMYQKINEAIIEADKKSKKLKRDQIDNIYLSTFSAVSSLNSQQKGKGDSHV